MSHEGMVFKVCSYCGVECWHTERVKDRKHNGHRCTKCGDPPGGAPNTWKRELAEAIRRRVAKRLV